MLVLGPFGRAVAQHLSSVDRASLVAQLWSVARATSATAWRAHVDWDAALADALRAAAPAQSDLQCLGVLRRLVALLGDGEAEVLPAAAVRSRFARPPLLLASVERRPFLVDFRENAELRVARPERLSEILTVQGVPAEDWIRDSILPSVGGATAADRWDRAVSEMLEGERGTAVRLELRRPDGARQGISVTRTVSANDRWPFALPAVAIEAFPGGVVVARVHDLADPDIVGQFSRALASVSGPRALILDLRDVTGGRPEYAYGVVGQLTAQPLPAPRRRMLLDRPAFELLAQPESAATWYWLPPDTIRPANGQTTYTGPLAVLSAATTAGAAEDLLAEVRGTGRGVIIGSASAGSPGESFTTSIGNGWSVTLSAIDDALPDGTAVPAAGLAPDVAVSQTVDEFLAGRDVVLQRAQAYLSAGAQ